MRKIHKQHPGIYIIATFLLTVPGCFIQSNSSVVSPTASKTEAFFIIVNYPVVISDSPTLVGPVRLYNMHDTLTVYSYNGYKIYKLAPTVMHETGLPIPNTEPFFVFKRGDKYGMYFPSPTEAGGPEKVLADSLLKKRAFTGVVVTLNSNARLIDSIIDERGYLVERYALPQTPDPLAIDSAYLYFSKSYNNIEHSWSKTLDSLRKMKLYKVRLLFNEKKHDTADVMMPKREYLFELQHTDIINTNELNTVIEKYEKLFNQK
jgi:hypothetical protein